jgi:hypothetical protein
MELILHRKFLSRTNIKFQNGLVLPPAQDFYFNGQALHYITYSITHNSSSRQVRVCNVKYVLDQINCHDRYSMKITVSFVR